MIANFKILGLGLLTILALGAMTASAASAQQGMLTSDGEWTGFWAETGGAGANRITFFGASLECPGSTYTLHEYEKTPHTLIPPKTTTVTITPHYKQVGADGDANCVGPFGWPATIDMNGCDYDIHVGETTGGVAGTYGATLDVTCDVGKEITVTFWTTKAEQTSKPTEPVCKIHVPKQLGLKGAHLTNTAGGTIDLTGTIEGIKAKMTKPNNDTILCLNQETTTGKFDVNAEFTAKNAGGGATAVEITHP